MNFPPLHHATSHTRPDRLALRPQFHSSLSLHYERSFLKSERPLIVATARLSFSSY